MRMDFNLMAYSAKSIRLLRFVLGLTLALTISFAVNWPLAFIMPVFVAKFLASEQSKLSLKAFYKIFVVMLIAFLAGLIVARLLLPYPVVFIALMSLAIFWISYWNHAGGNDFVVTMLLVGLTLVPMLSLNQQAVADTVTVGFLVSSAAAILLTMLMHKLVPDQHHQLAEKSVTAVIEQDEKVRLALMSTLIIMPMMIFFFITDLSSAVLVLVFVAILAQKPDVLEGIKGAKALLLGNCIGGFVAMVAYSLLTIVPEFSFLVMLSALIFTVFGRKIFSGQAIAPLFGMALTTVIILIATASLGDASAGEKFYLRIVQIAFACFYIIFTTMVMALWLENKHQQKQDDLNHTYENHTDVS